jgi:rhomboid protease GluP
VTYALIGITIAFYLLQVGSVIVFGYPSSFTNMDWLELFGARINDLIRAGQVWRFLTPALLHGSITHIFFNMYALFSLGNNLERYFGHGRFLLLYALGAFAGNVASFLFTDGYYSVGASTAIFGLIGAEGVFLYQNRTLLGSQARQALGNIIFVAVVNLFIIGSLPFIDNWGHIGGLLGGLMFTSLAGPLWEVETSMFGYTLDDRRSFRDVVIGAAAVGISFGVLALWGMAR